MFRKTHQRLVIVLFVVGLLLLATPVVFAQGGETPPPLTDIEQQGQEALAMIYAVIKDLISLPFAAGIVAVAVALLKRFLPDTINANVLNFAVTAIVWIIYVIAIKLDVDPLQFEVWTQQITKILESVVVLFPFIGGSFAVSRAYYLAARQLDMPLVGWQRPDLKGSWRGLYTMLFGPTMKV